VVVPYDPKITGFIPLTGGTATGQITVPGANPTVSNQAARKAWIDYAANLKITQPQADARVIAVGDPRWVNVAGDTRSGALTITSNLLLADRRNLNFVFKHTALTSMWVHHNLTGAGAFANSFDVGHAAAYLLSVHTNGVAYANTTWIGSDIRGKRDIEKHEEVLPKLRTLSAFEYTVEHKEGDALHTAGVSAQEVQKVFPELVSTIKITVGDHNNDGTAPIVEEQLCLNLDGWLAVLAQGTNELKQKVDKLLGSV
jgi:hypothetical protein